METAQLFENASDAQLARFLRPSVTAWSVDEFLTTRHGDLAAARSEEEKRKSAWLASALPDAATAARFRATVEALGGALLGTEEGVVYAFDEAGAFPGAGRIRDAALAYVRAFPPEPNAEIFEHAAAREHERGTLAFQCIDSATQSSLAFRELALGLPTIDERPPLRRPVVVSGRPATLTEVALRTVGGEAELWFVDAPVGTRTWIAAQLRRRGLVVSTDVTTAPTAGRRALVLPLRPIATVFPVTAVLLRPPPREESGTALLFPPRALLRLRNAGVEIDEPLAGEALVARTIATLTEQRAARARVFVDDARVEEVALAPRVRRLDRASESRPFRGKWEALSVPARRIPLSATQLAAHETCPAAYLFRHRLALRCREGAEEGFPRLLGTAVHGVLERLFSLSEADRVGAHALPQAFSEWLAARGVDDPVPESLLPFLRWQSLRLVAGGLDAETTLRGLVGEPAERRREEPFRWHDGNFDFVGRWDRVDRLADGRMLLLDYKTGEVKFTPEHAASGRDWQAALYLLAGNEQFGDKFCGVAFIALREGTVERGALRSAVVDKIVAKAFVRGHALDDAKWASLLARCREKLHERTAAMASEAPGAYAPTPGPEQCGRCDSGVLCRRSAAQEGAP